MSALKAVGNRVIERTAGEDARSVAVWRSIKGNHALMSVIPFSSSLSRLHVPGTIPDTSSHTRPGDLFGDRAV